TASSEAAVPSSAAASSPASTAASPATPTGGAAAAAALLPQEFRDKGFIGVASDIPYPPMEILNDDGSISGLDYDLSQALGEVLGIEVQFNKQAWDSIIPSLKAGRHDVIWSGMNDTLEREKTLDFVNYFRGGMAIMVKKGNPEGITTLLDLCGKTVAVQTSTVQGDLVTAASKDCPSGEITVIELPTDADAQNAVRAGKATADVLDAAVAAYAAQTAGDGQYFEVIIDPANPEGYSPIFTGVGILKEDSGLTAAVQAGLQELLDNGTYQQILDKYDLGAYGVQSIVINGATQ
ncbi:MAG: ABC transporter substrate-binding protein, partial [Candidatus Nanopelagicales bacterium]